MPTRYGEPSLAFCHIRLGAGEEEKEGRGDRTRTTSRDARTMGTGPRSSMAPRHDKSSARARARQEAGEARQRRDDGSEEKRRAEEEWERRRAL